MRRGVLVVFSVVVLERAKGVWDCNMVLNEVRI